MLDIVIVTFAIQFLICTAHTDLHSTHNWWRSLAALLQLWLILKLVDKVQPAM